MSALLTQVLGDSTATLDQVLAVMQEGIDPLYANGDTVSLALEKFGLETLREWYNSASSTVFLAGRNRARKLVNAALARYELYNEETECLEEIIENDGREDKEHSIAYLYLIRTALVRNWSRLALLMVQRIPYNVGTFLDAIDLDYEQIRGTLESDTEDNAYITVLQHLIRTLTGNARNTLTAFITLKVFEGDSIVSVAAALLVSQNPHDYLLASDYTGRWGAMLAVMMEASLQRDIAPENRDNDLTLSEMYDNIGRFDRSEWETLQESFRSIARAQGMSQEEIDSALAQVDLERVHYLAPYREALLEDLLTVYTDEKVDDFNTEADVDRLVEALKAVKLPQMEDEGDRYDVETIRRKVIGVIRSRYAHWE